MKSKDLEMYEVNKAKINNYSSPIRSFSMYSIVSRYHYNEYVIRDISGLDWLVCDLLNGVFQVVRRGDLTWLLHLLICVYMIVKQIDLFLHISLRQIYSSFLLCNKVSYLDLHSKCLRMDWYLTSLFYHTLSLYTFYISIHPFIHLHPSIH